MALFYFLCLHCCLLLSIRVIFIRGAGFLHVLLLWYILFHVTACFLTLEYHGDLSDPGLLWLLKIYEGRITGLYIADADLVSVSKSPVLYIHSMGHIRHRGCRGQRGPWHKQEVCISNLRKSFTVYNHSYTVLLFQFWDSPHSFKEWQVSVSAEIWADVMGTQTESMKQPLSLVWPTRLDLKHILIQKRQVKFDLQ